jgi:DNA-binding NarL/FixJ family response regulator
MTARQLRRAEDAYRNATGRADERKADRNAAIRQALAEGWTHQQIADATGLTRGRVSQVKATT